MWDDAAVIEYIAKIIKKNLLDRGIANKATIWDDISYDMAEDAWLYARRKRPYMKSYYGSMLHISRGIQNDKR